LIQSQRLVAAEPLSQDGFVSERFIITYQVCNLPGEPLAKHAQLVVLLHKGLFDRGPGVPHGSGWWLRCHRG
jgi:hypothetical protein